MRIITNTNRLTTHVLLCTLPLFMLTPFTYGGITEKGKEAEVPIDTQSVKRNRTKAEELQSDAPSTGESTTQEPRAKRARGEGESQSTGGERSQEIQGDGDSCNRGTKRKREKGKPQLPPLPPLVFHEEAKRLQPMPKGEEAELKEEEGEPIEHGTCVPSSPEEKGEGKPERLNPGVYEALKEALAPFAQQIGINIHQIDDEHDGEIQDLIKLMYWRGLTNKIPVELWLQILSYLPPEDKARYRDVSTLFRALIGDDSMWSKDQQDLFYQMYGQNPGQVSKVFTEEFRKLYEEDPYTITSIPTLDIHADQLGCYIPFGHIIRKLKIVGDADEIPFHLLSSFPKLIGLDLSDTDITDDHLEVLVKNCPNLRYLNLSDCGSITDTGFIAVVERCKEITTLDLSGCRKITDASIIELAKNCSNLTELVLSKTKTLNSIDLVYFSNPSNIVRLSLKGFDIKDFSLFKNFIHLTQLNLSETNVADKDLKHLPEGLVKLNLECTDIDGAGFSDLPKKLQELNVCCTHVKDKNLFRLPPHLTCLDLSETKIENIDNICHLENISRLTLYDCKKIEDISPLEHLPSLTSLCLEGCTKISRESLEHLPENLMALNLDENAITDFSFLGRLTKLSMLTLRNSKFLKQLGGHSTPDASISNAALRVIVQSCPNLTELYLEGCKGIMDFSCLKNLQYLQFLGLPEYSLDKEELEVYFSSLK